MPFDIPEGKALRIAKWHERHENAESRKVRGKLQWIRVPTSSNSLGLLWLLRQKRGVEAFGTYILLAELSANCSPRGTFSRGDNPLGLNAISDAIHVDKRPLRHALGLMMTRDCPWFDLVDCGPPGPITLPDESIVPGHKNKNKNKNKNPLPPGVRESLTIPNLIRALGVNGGGVIKINSMPGLTAGTLVVVALETMGDKNVRSWRAVLPSRLESRGRCHPSVAAVFDLLQKIAIDHRVDLGGLVIDVGRLKYNSKGITSDGEVIIDGKTITSL